MQSESSKILQAKQLVFVCLVSLFSFVVPAHSQAALIQGVAGNIEIFPNANLQQVVVAVTANAVLNENSNQIVFVVKGDFAAYPKKYVGSGRVLISQGVLMVFPGDEPAVAFKFPEQVLPKRLASINSVSFPVYQISRYGEKKSLTDSQISELEVSGKYTKPSDANIAAAVNRLQAPDLNSATVTPNITNPGGPICQAGGPGSDSCGAGGCNVSCKEGYFSCCSGGVCNCVKGS